MCGRRMFAAVHGSSVGKGSRKREGAVSGGSREDKGTSRAAVNFSES